MKLTVYTKRTCLKDRVAWQLGRLQGSGRKADQEDGMGPTVLSLQFLPDLARLHVPPVRIIL